MLRRLEGGSGGDRAPRADADAKLRDLEPLGLVSWGVRNEGSNMALFAALGSGARATLESAGIRLVDEFWSPPTPYLYLAVFLRDTLEVTAYRAHLRLVEIVPHRSGAYVDALLWETPDVLGVAHRDSADSAALAAADKLLQRFLGDYLRVNPR